ncbi:hypothetical protein [Cellulomonas sp. ATA003]|uniref:hypothetical protein n=1 Tax=Cellulomonas sp. ATA003 TaxID=3073064 RepID=UPI002873907E|nr:hypothetical protein [Cellulomonas sp. ATA003]WNB86461.1 hypothetical protein REH70_04270 [Cellulomonas sp. ATA003]
MTGLDDPDSPDVDLPLMQVVERLLDELLERGFELRERAYAPDGAPGEMRTRSVASAGADPLIVILATRNQAVDDAHAVVDRLIERHGLPADVLVASTVDSWQGQTNGITIALHPLSGADGLDEFNSAFGRLAVACTRATHGLLLLARAGLDDLLDDAPARPGTPSASRDLVPCPGRPMTASSAHSTAARSTRRRCSKTDARRNPFS